MSISPLSAFRPLSCGVYQPKTSFSNSTNRNNRPFDSGRFKTCASDKREAARKALESALGDKKDSINRWSNEIEARKINRGDGGGGKGGNGGGDGSWSGGWDGMNEWWQGMKETVLAILGFVFIILLLSQGSKISAVILNRIWFALRGFKNDEANLPKLQTGSASDVAKKWGNDD